MKKQGDAKSQHFLPQCYLEGFAGTDGRLATLNLETFVKYGKRPFPKLFSPAQICYDNDFYTIDPEVDAFQINDVADKFFIEKSFHHYENQFGRLIEKVTGQDELTAEEASFLIKIILDFKFRNKYFREKLIAPIQSRVIDEASDEILSTLLNDPEYLKKFEGATLEEMISINQNVRTKLYADKEFGKNAHLSALLKKSDGYDQMIASYTTKTLNYRWIVFKTDDAFISNDNPGFSMDRFNNIHNSYLKENFMFFFPLTSSLLLTFSDAAVDKEFIKNPQKKHVPKLMAPKEFIDTSNLYCLQHYNKIIFGAKESQMRLIADQLTLKNDPKR